MTSPVVFNSTDTCYIFPRIPSFPDGLLLNYTTCPDIFTNNTKKLVRWCCIGIFTNTFEQSTLKKLQNWLTYYGSTMLVGPAIFFNLISLVVLKSFRRSNYNSTSTSFYMKCLCIFDTLTILSKFLHESIVTRNSIRTNPIEFNSVFCKFDHFFESVFAITSIYILIAMSFDKLICVLRPLKVGSLLTTRKARITVLFIVIFAIIYSSYNLYTQRVQILQTSYNGYVSSVAPVKRRSNSTNIVQSDTQSNWTDTRRTVYDCDSVRPDITRELQLIDNIIRVFIPIILLVVCNTSIVLALSHARKSTLAVLTNANCSNRSPAYQVGSSLIKKSEPDIMEFQQQADRMNKTALFNERAKKNSNYILIMLFAVCLGFVVLNLPCAIRMIFERTFREKFQILEYLYHSDSFTIEFTKRDVKRAVDYEFFSFISYFLLDLNYVTNFFLYFLSGSRFRSKLFSMIPFRRNTFKTRSTSFNSSRDATTYHNTRVSNGKKFLDCCCSGTSRKNYDILKRFQTNNGNTTFATEFVRVDSTLNKRNSLISMRRDTVV